MKIKCDLSGLEGLCLDLGNDFWSNKFYWRVPNTRDYRGIYEIVTNDDAKKIWEIFPVAITRLVRVIIISNEDEDDNKYVVQDEIED